jgi:chromosome segregation ATPase
MRGVLALAFLAYAAASVVDEVQAEAAAAASNSNPIRKVVTLLQAMQKKVEEEGKKEKELYDNFMCYCKTNGQDLTARISSANTKVPQVQSEIEQAEAQKAQLEQDLQGHQSDREAAKTAMKDATAFREKEAAAFATSKAEYDANIAAVAKAVMAIEKGMSGGFLQTGAAQVLRKLLAQVQQLGVDMLDTDRQEVLSFLSDGQSTDYAPKSSEVVGILKELHDEMAKTLADMTGEEEAAVASFQELLAAKKKEVSVLSKAVEAKTERIGTLAVEIVQKKNDLTDTEAQLVEDQKFAADLEKGCGTKTGEMEERVKMRAEELVALSETIKILNDDDALDLFKKTLPSAGSSASFVQVKVGVEKGRATALALVRELQRKYSGRGDARRPDLDFLALALQGSKVGFEKVIKMIDDMVVNLKKEQKLDESKKAQCSAQLDSTDDQKKGFERTISDLETSMAQVEEAIETSKEEIKAAGASIKALDKQVADETEQRKAEHEEFTELMSSNSAAKEILGFAKNRLNKFYNPRLAAPASSPEGSSAMLAQVKAHNHGKAGVEPPPETFEGDYVKKTEETTGVIGMIDLLVKDLDKEMTIAETQEQDAQKDYEQFMKDSSAKRATDTESLTQKSVTQGKLETSLQSHKEKHASSTQELASVNQVIAALHSECDWLLKYFDMRREARTSEIDALGKAKAVLNGADYAFVQTKAGNLRRQPTA